MTPNTLAATEFDTFISKELCLSDLVFKGPLEVTSFLNFYCLPGRRISRADTAAKAHKLPLAHVLKFIGATVVYDITTMTFGTTKTQGKTLNLQLRPCHKLVPWSLNKQVRIATDRTASLINTSKHLGAHKVLG